VLEKESVATAFSPPVPGEWFSYGFHQRSVAFQRDRVSEFVVGAFYRRLVVERALARATSPLSAPSVEVLTAA
jgi:hypothetical protein